MHAHSINTQYITCITSSCNITFDSDLCLRLQKKTKIPSYILPSVDYYWGFSPDPWWWLPYEEKQKGHHNITAFLLKALAKFYPCCPWYCHWSLYADLQPSFPLFFAFIIFVLCSMYNTVEKHRRLILLVMMSFPLKFTQLLFVQSLRTEPQNQTHKNVWHLWRYFPKFYPEMLTDAC